MAQPYWPGTNYHDEASFDIGEQFPQDPLVIYALLQYFHYLSVIC